jgi:hypothetical protein
MSVSRVPVAWLGNRTLGKTIDVGFASFCTGFVGEAFCRTMWIRSDGTRTSDIDRCGLLRLARLLSSARYHLCLHWLSMSPPYYKSGCLDRSADNSTSLSGFALLRCLVGSRSSSIYQHRPAFTLSRTYLLILVIVSTIWLLSPPPCLPSSELGIGTALT